MTKSTSWAEWMGKNFRKKSARGRKILTSRRTRSVSSFIVILVAVWLGVTAYNYVADTWFPENTVSETESAPGGEHGGVTDAQSSQFSNLPFWGWMFIVAGGFLALAFIGREVNGLMGRKPGGAKVGTVEPIKIPGFKPLSFTANLIPNWLWGVPATALVGIGLYLFWPRDWTPQTGVPEFAKGTVAKFPELLEHWWVLAGALGLFVIIYLARRKGGSSKDRVPILIAMGLPALIIVCLPLVVLYVVVYTWLGDQSRADAFFSIQAFILNAEDPWGYVTFWFAMIFMFIALMVHGGRLGVRRDSVITCVLAIFYIYAGIAIWNEAIHVVGTDGKSVADKARLVSSQIDEMRTNGGLDISVNNPPVRDCKPFGAEGEWYEVNTNLGKQEFCVPNLEEYVDEEGVTKTRAIQKVWIAVAFPTPGHPGATLLLPDEYDVRGKWRTMIPTAEGVHFEDVYVLGNSPFSGEIRPTHAPESVDREILIRTCTETQIRAGACSESPPPPDD